jgi:sentrin-specific protease 7
VRAFPFSCTFQSVDLFYSDKMRKCFERTVEMNRETQSQRLADVKNRPISNQRQIPSPNFPQTQNQQTSLADNLPRPAKLTSLLQSSFSGSKISGAGSRIPTVITGRGGTSPSAAIPERRISGAATKKLTSEQAQRQNTSRLRSASGRIPTTRSSVKAEMSTREEEDVPPRKKYSEVHGFGDPWKNPLVYPKAGKGRMAVEYTDLFRLDEDEFLNDNLIGFFLRYLEHHLEQTRPELAKKVYFYNSYFFERLMQTSKGKKGINYDSVQKWTRNIDIFSHDFIVMPVNESFHWYVVIICNLPKLNPSAKDDEKHDDTELLASEERAIAPERDDETPERIRLPNRCLTSRSAIMTSTWMILRLRRGCLPLYPRPNLVRPRKGQGEGGARVGVLLFQDMTCLCQ